jgi:hypothetical protein
VILRRFLQTLKAWNWWKKNHTERVYTLVSQEDARKIIWITFETRTMRVNYAVLPDSPELDLSMRQLMAKAEERLRSRQADEASAS